MVSGSAAADAVLRARRLPNLRVGLHLVLADGQALLPLEQIPGLTDAHGSMDANLWSRGVKYFASPKIRRQLQAEIAAQFEAFARTGLALDHVNVHKHFHLHPTLLSLLIPIARESGARAVRVPDEPAWFAARSGAAAVAANALLTPGLLFMKHRLRAAGLFHNDRIFGIAASGAMSEQHVLAALARLPHGVSEIYLHPATSSGAAIAKSMSGYLHTEELASLLSPRIRAAIAGMNVPRGGYGDALRHIGRSLA